MIWLKRVGFFALVNIGILIMLSIIISVFGLDQYMTAYGMDYSGLFMMCLVWGMGGAFISLWISKWMAKRMYGVEIISASGKYASLVQSVNSMARKAGLNEMPEVGIYESPDLNAFATGSSKSNSLIAVSTGLLQNMSREEVEGVLAHEVSHIANGDMVTMTLIQGVMNAFVMFAARVVTHIIDMAMRDGDRGGLGFLSRFASIIFFQIVFGILGSVVVAFFSRYREYKADKGSASIVGKHKMIAALESLKRNYGIMEDMKNNDKAFQSMQISSKSAFIALFSSHPAIDKRINALRQD